jgi:hypothetical protein
MPIDRKSPERGSGLRLSDGTRIHLEARRHLCYDPGEELRRIDGHRPSQIGGDATPFPATALVEDRNSRLEAGAVLGES